MKTNELMDRRMFLQITAAGLAMSFSPLISETRPLASSRIKAVAFDGFAIFDPRPIANLANALFPGRGTELVNEWRTRQYEYSWLRTVTGNYADFWRVTEDALTYAANKIDLSTSAGEAAQLIEAFLNLKPWPDVVPALALLKREGLPLAIISDLTPRMMEACVANSALQGIFRCLLSTDQVQAFKPDPRSYGMGTAALNLSREEILFVAYAGWDAAGSKRFGYPTYWVNRLHLPAEELGEYADATSADLNRVITFIRDRD